MKRFFVLPLLQIFWLSNSFVLYKKLQDILLCLSIFSYFELHEVKRFPSYLKQHHENNIARIDEVKPFYSEEHYIWNENVYYTLRNNYLNELIDYLFNLDV